MKQESSTLIQENHPELPNCGEHLICHHIFFRTNYEGSMEEALVP